jgi:hypothetical protein
VWEGGVQYGRTKVAIYVSLNRPHPTTPNISTLSAPIAFCPRPNQYAAACEDVTALPRLR